ncbi:MAG TPA: hypothetical protein VFK90_15790, partial [Anaeromyxobacter sp.]|nr:hypothetical protein [Anaeromyxobacter sp.]
MASTRRTFLGGAAGAIALAGIARRAEAADEKKAGQSGAMAKGLTLCNIQRGGSFSLGVKTSKGVLDVPAAKGKKNGLPATTDDVIRGIGDLNALRGLVADAESGK